MDKLENWCYKFDCKQTIITSKIFYTFALIVELVPYFVLALAGEEPSGEPVGVMEFFGNIYLTISKWVIEGHEELLLPYFLIISLPFMSTVSEQEKDKI